MAAETASSGDTPRNVVIVRETGKGKFQQEVTLGAASSDGRRAG